MCIWKHLARNNYDKQRVLARLLRLSTVSASIWRRRDCKAESFHIKNHFLHARRKNWKQSTDLKQSITFMSVLHQSRNKLSATSVWNLHFQPPCKRGKHQLWTSSWIENILVVPLCGCCLYWICKVAVTSNNNIVKLLAGAAMSCISQGCDSWEA